MFCKRFVVFSFILMVVLSGGLLLTEEAEKVAEHAKEKDSPLFDFITNSQHASKYYTMVLLGGIFLLLILKGKMSRPIKTTALLSTLFLFGIAGNIPIQPFSFFSMHPSPMCVTKAMLYGFALPFAFTLGVILLLTLIGPRLFCGFICPVGALQELIAMLADRLRIRRRKISFTISYGIRLGLFLLFVFISVTGILYATYEGERYSTSMYDYFNAFHGMEFAIPEGFFAGMMQYLPLILTMGLSFLLYRPFCSFVCPIGLFTHWAEQIGLLRVSLNRSRCTQCNACEKKAPCEAIPDILKESTLRPDCYSCQVCLDTCTEKALKIAIKRSFNGD